MQYHWRHYASLCFSSLSFRWFWVSGKRSQDQSKYNPLDKATKATTHILCGIGSLCIRHVGNMKNFGLRFSCDFRRNSSTRRRSPSLWYTRNLPLLYGNVSSMFTTGEREQTKSLKSWENRGAESAQRNGEGSGEGRNIGGKEKKGAEEERESVDQSVTVINHHHLCVWRFDRRLRVPLASWPVYRVVSLAAYSHDRMCDSIAYKSKHSSVDNKGNNSDDNKKKDISDSKPYDAHRNRKSRRGPT
jgi:hypothetical protein